MVLASFPYCTDAYSTYSLRKCEMLCQLQAFANLNKTGFKAPMPGVLFRVFFPAASGVTKPCALPDTNYAALFALMKFRQRANPDL